MTRAFRLVAIVSLATLSACGDAGHSDGRLGHEEQGLAICASGSVLEGIDVSHWEPNVNWAEVKAGGRVFGFVKATQGTYYTDTELSTNWANMKAAGVLRGAYHYMDWSKDALAQADYFVAALSKAGGLEAADLPPVLDAEWLQGTTADIKKVLPFLQRVHCLTGKRPMIYTGASFIDPLNPPSAIGGYPVWVAHYTSACPNVPKLWGDWTFWQYSDAGKIPGVSAAVDLDRFDGTLADLKTFIAQANVPAVGCSSSGGSGGSGGATSGGGGTSSGSGGNASAGGAGGAGGGAAASDGGTAGSGGAAGSSRGESGAAGSAAGAAGSWGNATPIDPVGSSGTGGQDARPSDAEGSAACAVGARARPVTGAFWLLAGAFALLLGRRGRVHRPAGSPAQLSSKSGCATSSPSIRPGW